MKVFILPRKSAIGYEWQFGRWYGRFCTLMGGNWKWYTFWDRWSFGWDTSDKEEG